MRASQNLDSQRSELTPSSTPTNPQTITATAPLASNPAHRHPHIRPTDPLTIIRIGRKELARLAMYIVTKNAPPKIPTRAPRNLLTPSISQPFTPPTAHTSRAKIQNRPFNFISQSHQHKRATLLAAATTLFQMPGDRVHCDARTVCKSYRGEPNPLIRDGKEFLET